MAWWHLTNHKVPLQKHKQPMQLLKDTTPDNIKTNTLYTTDISDSEVNDLFLLTDCSENRLSQHQSWQEMTHSAAAYSCLMIMIQFAHALYPNSAPTSYKQVANVCFS